MKKSEDYINYWEKELKNPEGSLKVISRTTKKTCYCYCAICKKYLSVSRFSNLERHSNTPFHSLIRKNKMNDYKKIAKEYCEKTLGNPENTLSFLGDNLCYCGLCNKQFYYTSIHSIKNHYIRSNAHKKKRSIEEEPETSTKKSRVSEEEVVLNMIREEITKQVEEKLKNYF